MKTFFPMICVGCLFLHLVSAAEGQAKLRNIQDAPLQPGSPITVVGREVGDKTFDGGNGVLVGRDWLRGLTLRVKNVSDKNIVYFNIDFIVSKQARMPGSIGLSVFFGNRTAPARTSPGDMVLRPGEIVKVRLSDDEFTYWDKVLKNYGADDIDRISMDIRTVHFEAASRRLRAVR